MIEAAIAPLRAQIGELQTALDAKFGVDDKIALQSDNGFMLMAKDGGPATTGQVYNLMSSNQITGWETWTLKKGME
jgi:hypothetical protein